MTRPNQNEVATRRIFIRITDAEKANIRDQAKIAGLTMSEYMRRIAFNKRIISKMDKGFRRTCKTRWTSKAPAQADQRSSRRRSSSEELNSTLSAVLNAVSQAQCRRGEVNMIVKVQPSRKHSSSFKRLHEYLTKEHDADTENFVCEEMWFLSENLLSFDTAAGEMLGVASLNDRCKDALCHYELAWPPGERPTRPQWTDAALHHTESTRIQRPSIYDRRARRQEHFPYPCNGEQGTPRDPQSNNTTSVPYSSTHRSSPTRN